MAITKLMMNVPKKDIKIKVVIPSDIVLEIPWYSDTPVEYLPDEYWLLVDKIKDTLGKVSGIVSINPNKLLKHYSEDVKEKKQNDSPEEDIRGIGGLAAVGRGAAVPQMHWDAMFNQALAQAHQPEVVPNIWARQLDPQQAPAPQQVIIVNEVQEDEDNEFDR